VVVDGDRKDLLRALLADHVIVERLLDLGGLREAATLLLEVPLRFVSSEMMSLHSSTHSSQM